MQFFQAIAYKYSEELYYKDCRRTPVNIGSGYMTSLGHNELSTTTTLIMDLPVWEHVLPRTAPSLVRKAQVSV